MLQLTRSMRSSKEFVMIKSQKVKNLIKALSFVLILVALMAYASLVFHPKTNEEGGGMDDQRAVSILAEPENTLDIVAVGNSDLYSGVLPMNLYETYGYTAYVCGQSKQSMPQAYDMLKKALSKQSPKLVIIETDTIFYGKNDLHKVVESEIDIKVPAIKYHDRWKQLKISDFYTGVKYDFVNPAKGYAYIKCTDIKPYVGGEYMFETEEREEMQPLARMYLDKMVKMCEKRNIPILFLELPSATSWNMKKHNAMSDYAKQSGYPFVDMNLMDVNIDWLTDTRDKGNHLNYNGALKTTAVLGEYLAENYTFPDRREDAKISEAWNADLESFKKKIEDQIG